ncbi:MAG: hypothetical protein ACLUOI_29085 [Eisenbergiella sp.]
MTTIEPEDSGSVFRTDMAAYGTVRILILRGICRILQETGFATLVGQRTGGSNSGGAILYDSRQSPSDPV